MSRKWWWIIGISVLVIGAGVGGYFANRSPAVEVQCDVVRKGILQSTVSASGKIRAQVEVNISAYVAAQVLHIPVKVGDAVKKGDLLVALDPTRYKAAADAAIAQRSSATNALHLAEANAAQAQANLVRAQSLSDKGLISTQLLEDAKTAASVTVSQVAGAHNAIQSAEAQFAEANQAYLECNIRAPVDAIVSQVNAKEGEIAMIGTMDFAGTVLMTLADRAAIEAEVEVDETDIVDVKMGQTSRIQVDAYPDSTLTGTVIEIGQAPIRGGQLSVGPAQDQVTQFSVKLAVEHPPANLLPGMSCTADIVTKQLDDVLSVPIQSVVLRPKPGVDTLRAMALSKKRRGGVPEGYEQVVFLKKGDKAVKHAIATGITGEIDMQVTGATPGDSVISGPYRTLRNLKDGDAVELEGSKKSHFGFAVQVQ